MWSYTRTHSHIQRKVVVCIDKVYNVSRTSLRRRKKSGMRRQLFWRRSTMLRWRNTVRLNLSLLPKALPAYCPFNITKLLNVLFAIATPCQEVLFKSSYWTVGFWYRHSIPAVHHSSRFRTSTFVTYCGPLATSCRIVNFQPFPAISSTTFLSTFSFILW